MAYKIDSITAGTVYTPTVVMQQNFYELSYMDWYYNGDATGYTSFGISEINNLPNEGEVKTYKLKTTFDIINNNPSYYVFLGNVNTDSPDTTIKISKIEGSFNQVNNYEGSPSSYIFGYGAFIDDSNGGWDSIEDAYVYLYDWDIQQYQVWAYIYPTNCCGNNIDVHVGLEIEIQTSGTLTYNTDWL